MGAGENHPGKQLRRDEPGLLQAGLGEQMAGGRAGVDKGEGAALEVGQLADAAVLARDNHALVGALPGFAGDGDREGFDLGHRGGEDVGEWPQVRDVELAGAQRFDDAVVVGRDKGHHRHAQPGLQGIEHLFAGFDHRLRVFGGDQANGQLVFGAGQAGGGQGEGDAGNTQE
ncbi:hypothetical protein D3C81_1481940 [compost metagenome]